MTAYRYAPNNVPSGSRIKIKSAETPRAGNLAALEVLWSCPISSRILQPEERGEIDRAVEYYADFVALWRIGIPCSRPGVRM